MEASYQNTEKKQKKKKDSKTIKMQYSNEKRKYKDSVKIGILLNPSFIICLKM